MEKQNLTATLLVFDAASGLIGQERRSVETSYRSVIPVFNLRRYDGLRHYVFLTLTAEDGSTVADNFYCIGTRNNDYDFARSTWYYTPVKKWTDLSFVFAQDPADIDVKVVPTEEGYEVTLENRSRFIAPQLILKACDADGNLAVPVYWSDNFFAMMPGQTKTVTCHTAEKGLDVFLAER